MFGLSETKAIMRKIGFSENQIDEMTSISDYDHLLSFALNEDEFISDINYLFEMKLSHGLIAKILCSRFGGNDEFFLLNCYRVGDFRELLENRNPYRYYNLYCLLDDTNLFGRSMTFLERAERNGFRVAWYDNITEGDLLIDDIYDFQKLFDFCIKQEVTLEFYFNGEIDSAINENSFVKGHKLLPVAFADSNKDNPDYLLLMNEKNQYLIKNIKTEIYGIKFLENSEVDYMRKIKWKNTLRGMFM